MRLLSFNAHKQDVSDLIDSQCADIFCIQESRINLQGASINAVNIKDKELLPKEPGLSDVWQEMVPWIEFPENYFAESLIDEEECQFVLINVHLAGFNGGKRLSLMSTLLKRLRMQDLQKKNVILLGDFNAQKVSGKATLRQRQGSAYLRQIEAEGFAEVLMTGENVDMPEATYKDGEIPCRYDHVYVRKVDEDFDVTIINYYPEKADDVWHSDHRGILIEVTMKH